MNDLIESTISLMKSESQVAKSKIKFFIHIIILNLSFRGRFNFLNMSRFGKHNEKTYRTNFANGFPFFLLMLHT